MTVLTRWFVSLVLALAFVPGALAQPELTGVNLAGAEFGEHTLPGRYDREYTYPTSAEVDYFTGLGMNVFRLPFRWERLQREAFADLHAEELERMDAFVEVATAAGAKVILDPHNYARYYGDVIGSEALSVDAFGDFWSRLATHYADDEDVIFGLMNEPHDMPTEQWLDGANAAIDAIRSAGAENLILVPGNGWTGAHSWYQNWYGTPNATAMQGVVDPLDHYAIEVHQYLDSNSSGTSPTCVRTTVGSERLVQVTSWLQEQGLQGVLGEFGVAANATCLQALDDMLTYVDDHADVWLGWTYWAAGPWWGDYMFSIEPDDEGNDRPQTAVLLDHLAQPTAVEPGPSGAAPRALTLWPNPTHGTATLQYALGAAGPVEVSVFDLLGRRVQHIDEGIRPAGRHAVSLSLTTLVPGTYVVRLQDEQGAATHSITILR